MLQRGVIWATTVKYTQLKKDYEARIVRQELFEICRGRGVLPMKAYTLPERGIFFRLQVYERVGISLVEVY